MPRTPVALVLAGQLRDHFRSVFPLLNATLLSTPEFDVDVFVCTWNTLGSSVHTQRHTPRHSESALLVAEQPWHLYGDRVVALRLERPSLNMSYTLHNLSIPRELAEKAGHWSWSTLPHLWLQSRCRREILLSGTSYRAVVAIRPDSKFWTPAVAAGLVWSVRNLDASWRDGGGEHKIELFLSPFALPTPRHASDKYAVGTQHAMLYYLDGWRAAPAYWSRPPWNRSSWGESVHLVGERLVWWHLQAGRVDFDWGWMPGFSNPAEFPRAPALDFLRDLVGARTKGQLPTADCRRLGLPPSLHACAHTREASHQIAPRGPRRGPEAPAGTSAVLRDLGSDGDDREPIANRKQHFSWDALEVTNATTCGLDKCYFQGKREGEGWLLYRDAYSARVGDASMVPLTRWSRAWAFAEELRADFGVGHLLRGRPFLATLTREQATSMNARMRNKVLGDRTLTYSPIMGP